MTKVNTLIGSLFLCSLLGANRPPSSINSNTPNIKLDTLEFFELTYTEPNFSSNKTIQINPNDKLDITSTIYLSINKFEDPHTRKGIEDALKKNFQYANHRENLLEAYAKSNAEALILGGHHFAGTLYLFDNKKKSVTFEQMPKNENIQFILFRGCHSVMNPEFLKEESQKHKYLMHTAEEYIQAITNFAPNVRLIMGYETKSRFEKDDPLIKLAQNLNIIEQEGYKSYGLYALDVTKKMYKEPGNEKDEKGNWAYCTHFHKKPQEGARLAFYLKEEDGWKFYSLNHREGIAIDTTRNKNIEKIK
ncbi:MAG: hypothetical protein WC758_01550 [Candidatus Woesearchaeota archaeon]|jgi:hypothetical protein